MEAPSCNPQDIPKSGVSMDQTFRIWRTVRQLKIFVKVFGLVRVVRGWSGLRVSQQNSAL